jgi:probable HAF family extracellular repeat protein
LIAAAAAAQPTITNLGTLGSGNPLFSFAEGVSADGQVVIGISSSSAGQRAIRWTAGGGMQNLGVLAGYPVRSSGAATSADGAVVTGVSTGSGNIARAFRWTAATGVQSIGVLGSGSASYGRAISANGSVIAGSSYAAGFNGATATRWTAATGIQTIGGTGSTGGAISADGSVIAGTDVVNGFFSPFRWTASGGRQILGIPVGADSAEAHAMSADGSVVAGYFGDQFNGTFSHAARWTQLPGNQVAQDLGTLDGGEFSYAYALSADGSIVGGVSSLPNGDLAFLWSPASGLVNLNTYLPSLGLDLTGWTLTAVRGISADGSTIVGNGSFNGTDLAFIVRGLPGCRPAVSDQPENSAACFSGEAHFSVTATGDGTLRFQWRKGAVAINTTINPSAATATLSLSGLVATDAGQFDCVITNACGATTTDPVSLTVCIGDYNCDGGVDGQDVESFFLAWESGESAGDVNADGGVDGQDVEFFFVRWEAGC